MLSKKKKIIIVASFCLLLVVTGVLNLVLNRKATESVVETNTVTTQNVFNNYRENRKLTRTEQMAELDAIINDMNASEETRANAQAKKDEIFARMNMELQLETLITSQGFDDCIIISSANSINVVIKLNRDAVQEDIDKIMDIVEGNSDYVLDNMEVTCKK